MNNLAGSVGLVQSFSRRSLQERTLSESTRQQNSSTDSTDDTTPDLQAQLQLSAKIGQALLEEKETLEKRVITLDKVNQKLLDRLANAAKENDQLQSRLEEAVSNLEQAEANNRTLLVTLESDRKRMSRLSGDSARLTSTTAQLQSLSSKAIDTNEELLFEQKRATLAENRAVKAIEHVTMLEARLKKAIEDLEEVRTDRVLRTKKSFKALAKVKAKLVNRPLALDDNPEASELLILVETLVSENELLRSNSMELTGLLEASREEQSDLRQVMDNQREVDFSRGTEATGLLSPTNTRGLFEFDITQSNSSTSTNPTSFARSWAPSSTLTQFSEYRNQRNGSDPLSLRRGLDSVDNGAVGGSNSDTGGIVPIGRRRRPLSVNLESTRRVSMERDTGASGPVSPMMDVYSSSSRTTSIYSDSEDAIRPRHPRPLSLSFGPSLFSHPVPEERSMNIRSRQSPRQSPTPPSISTFENQQPTSTYAPSGLSLSSPTKNRGHRSLLAEDDTVATVNSSTQTSPPPRSNFFSSTSHPTVADRSRSIQKSNTSHRASSTTSNLSEREKTIPDFDISSPPGASIETRSAALGKLIEYTTKILVRLQSSDIVSQEKRLKKQKLLGDVRHLAHANLKEVVHDIEGLRPHFRRVLELERATAAKEASSAYSEHLNDSLTVRRDFVSLVKLFRDLLFETSRLRSIVNRVQLEPALASQLRDLDVENALEIEPVQRNVSGSGLVARFLSAGGINEVAEPSRRTLTSRASMRPIGIGSVSSATVNVGFESGVGRAVTVDQGGVTRSPGGTEPRSSSTTSTPPPPVSSRRKPVKRELNSIFAGALSSSKLPSAAASASFPVSNKPSSNPFSRLLAYRPALSSTTNAILDSFQHNPRSDRTVVEPTLLERTLRPRGLSDSSIRSTFVAHANPHHRLISPASLALSSEVSTSDALPILYQNENAAEDVAQQLTELQQSGSLSTASLSRRSSQSLLRSRPSIAQMRSASLARDIIPPVPPMPSSLPLPLPISISISPSSARSTSPGDAVETLATPFGPASLAVNLYDGLSSFASSFSLGVATEAGMTPATMIKRGEQLGVRKVYGVKGDRSRSQDR